MKKTVLSVLFASAILLAACAPKSAPSNPSTTTQGSAAPLSGNVSIDIAGFAFSPKDVTVKVGTTVTWTNLDTAGHNVVASDKSWGSSTLQEGDTFSQTFTTTGTFEYVCSFHAGMKGTITVVE